jgi:hypothetical protein
VGLCGQVEQVDWLVLPSDGRTLFILMYMCRSICMTHRDTYVGHTCQVELSGAGYVLSGSTIQGGWSKWNMWSRWSA